MKIIKGVTGLSVDILSADKNSVTYTVSGVPLSCFSQHRRARVGIKFYDVKLINSAVIYSKLYDNLTTEIIDSLTRIINLQFEKNDISYAPMSQGIQYTVTQTIESLKLQMQRRLKFCEEEFIVGLHWLLRDKLIKMSIVDDTDFYPFCDKIGYCDYISNDDFLAASFGCLFGGCGRHQTDTDSIDYISFNESCSDRNTLIQQLGIQIPEKILL